MAIGFGNEIDRMVVAVVADPSGVTTGLKKAERNFRDFERQIGGSMQNASRSFAALGTSLRGLGGGLVAGAGVGTLGVVFSRASQAAASFEAQMAEVNTLLSDTSSIRTLERAVTDASKAFGKDAGEQARALYQIISSGASEAAQAIDILTTANRLALGGVTDVATAADGLTTILNAFGRSAGTAANVSDAMFVAMRAGKTTIGELSQSIGVVAPLAAQAGASLEEVLAATSALTKGGVSTNVAMTGLRAILAGIAKPSKEAADEAKRLGLNFSAAGLKSQGFSRFIADIQRATGGSTESLTKLFGGVEALVPVMALAGNASADFTTILGQMADRAGETEAAFDKLNATAGQAFAQLRQTINASLRDSGSALNDVLAPAARGLVNNFDDLVIAVASLTKALAVAGGAFVTFKAAMAIETVLVAATRGLVAFRVALVAITGPVGAAVTAIGLIAAAFYRVEQQARAAAEASRQLMTEFEGAIANMAVPDLEQAIVGQSQAMVQIQAQIAAAVKKVADAEKEVEEARKSNAAWLTNANNRLIESRRNLEALQGDYRSLQRDTQGYVEQLEKARIAAAQMGASDEAAKAAAAIARQAQEAADALARTALAGKEIDALAAQATNAADRLGELARRGESITPALRLAREAHDKIEDAIRDQGGALNANMKLLDASRRLADELREALDFDPELLRNPLKGLKLATVQVDLSPINVPEVQKDALDAATTATLKLEAAFQSATVAGRGLVQIADGMGKIDDATRKALDGVLGLVDAFGELNRARELAARSKELSTPGTGFDAAGAAAASIASMVATVSGIIGAIGGLVSIVQGLFAESPAQAELKAAIKSNEEALDKLRFVLENTSSLLQRQLGSVDALGQVLATGLGRDIEKFGTARGLGSAFSVLDVLDERLRQAGSSLKELDRLAADAGITLRNSVGEIIPGALSALSEALHLAAVAAASFTNSINDQVTIMDARVQIRDLDMDPLAAAQRWQEFFAKNMPDFAETIRAFDLSTEEGRAALDQWIKGMFSFFEQGGFGASPELLGNFARWEDFLKWLVDGSKSLDALADSADTAAEAMKQTTEALRNVPAGFKVAYARWNATTPDVTMSPFGSNYITDPGFLPPGGAGGGNLTITGPVYVDARTKPVDVALAELTAEARRDAHARTGSTSRPFNKII